MRFISMIRHEENTGQKPSEQLMKDMGKLMEVLTRSGQLISTAGLRPTSEGFGSGCAAASCRCPTGRLRNEGDHRGYAILEAKSKEEAIEITRRFLKIHGNEWDLECEVRPLDGRNSAARAAARSGRNTAPRAPALRRPRCPTQ
jgi:hypothetical protein